MHELSIAYSLLEQVLELNHANNGKRVEKITVQVGELTGIVPQYLEFCFIELAKNSAAQEAGLLIEKTLANLICSFCDWKEKFNGSAQLDNCPKCGEITNVSGGDELTLLHVEVEINEGCNTG